MTTRPSAEVGITDKAKKASLISISTLAILGVLKYLVGVLSGSIALVADAVHYLSDALTSFFVYIGLRIADREPTKEFPYGFYKIENIISLFISLLLFFIAFGIIKESLSNFGEKTLKSVPLSMAVASLSAAIAFVLARYKIDIGKEVGSPSLTADGQHTMADVYSSLAVLLGLLGFSVGIAFADQLAGVLVSVFIVHSGYGILKDSLKVLMDACLCYEALDTVRSTIQGFPGVKSVRSLKGRSSGRFTFLEVEIETQLRDLEKAQELKQRIEGEVKKRIKNVDRVLIQALPVKKEFVRFAVPLRENRGIDSGISEHFGKAAYFCIFDLREGKVGNMRFVENSHSGTEKKRGIETAKFLVEEGIDVLAVQESLEGKGPGYVLGDAFVKMEQVNYRILKEAVDGLRWMER